MEKFHNKQEGLAEIRALKSFNSLFCFLTPQEEVQYLLLEYFNEFHFDLLKCYFSTHFDTQIVKTGPPGADALSGCDALKMAGK